jgi:alanyl aminopeptidase
VTTQLAALGRAILAGESPPQLASLAPELRDEALTVALREGGAPALEQAIAKLATTEDAQVRQRLLSAISLLDDPALGDRVLGLALDSVLRTNERLTPLFGQAGQRTTRDHAYTWFKQNFDALMAELGPRARSGALGVVGHFCSEERAADARAFLGPKVKAIPGGDRSLALALESVDQCEAFAKAQAESARAYFRANTAAKAVR